MYVSVSTPLYGIAAGHKEAEKFLEYLEGWITHFEKLPANNPDKPRLRIACWNAKSNIDVFQRIVKQNLLSPEARVLMCRFAELLKKMRDIGLTRKADVHLNYSDRNDSRIFILADAKNNNYQGIMVVFSPITFSSINHHVWHLIGISFADHQGYENVHYIFEQLQQQDYEEVSCNRIDALAHFRQWLIEQYGLTEQELFGQG